jgi:hypothetical protein
MFGFKINFDKSEVLMIGGDSNLDITYAKIFNCQIGVFPLKYLGVLISAGRLHAIDWAKLEVKSAYNLHIWHESYLSIGWVGVGSILINASLTNSSIYHMSIFLLPKIVVKRMDKGIRMFFWQGNKLKTSYPFMKRSKIWKSKNKKGRGGASKI